MTRPPRPRRPKKCEAPTVRKVEVRELPREWLEEGKTDRAVWVTRSCGHGYNWSGPPDELPQVGSRSMSCLGPERKTTVGKDPGAEQKHSMGWRRWKSL